MKEERKLSLKKAWLDVDATKAEHLAGKVPIGIGVTVALSMHMKDGDRETYGLTKDRVGKIVGWKSNEKEPAHTSDTTHFTHIPDIVYVQFFEKDGTPAAWTHPEVPKRPGVYPVKKTNETWYVAGNRDQTVKRFQIPLVPGLTSTIHVAQGAEMSPIIMLDELVTPTAVFVGVTRSKRSRNCLIMPSDKFDFGVFGCGKLLNEKNELLLAHLRGDADFEENLAKYHRCRKAKKPKADAARVSSARALAGENGDRDRKREGGENGDRDRKREGGENGDRDRKGGDRAQQQAAGREGGRAGDVEDKRKAGRAGDVEDKRGAGQSSGRARGAAARRRRGQDDAATIAATTNNRGRKSVRERVASANGMTVSQAIQQSIYTTRTLKADEAAGYIQLVRAAEAGLAGFDEPNSVGSPMDEDNFAHNPIDDFSD
jgi:hypothetical protein